MILKTDPLVLILPIVKLHKLLLHKIHFHSALIIFLVVVFLLIKWKKEQNFVTEHPTPRQFIYKENVKNGKYV